MTTSSQQTVLTDDEIACLTAIAQGMPRPATDPVVCALAAKGMLESDPLESGTPAGHRLTPAGQLAVNVAGPGMVSGIDT